MHLVSQLLRQVGQQVIFHGEVVLRLQDLEEPALDPAPADLGPEAAAAKLFEITHPPLDVGDEILKELRRKSRQADLEKDSYEL